MPPSNTPSRPVARVLPLLGIAHLDRLFDYTVPEKWADSAQPGTLVRVRFGGRLVDAIVVERRSNSDHPSALKPLKRVISPKVVLPQHMWRLVNELAVLYAGNRSDVIKAAIPPRHASAESAGLYSNGASWEELLGTLIPRAELEQTARSAAERLLAGHKFGDAYLEATLAGRAPHGHLAGVPGQRLTRLAAAVAAAVAWNTDGGVLIVTPHAREVARVRASLQEWMAPAQITELTSSMTAATRYRRFLAALDGQARVVVGTRSAALAPVKDLRQIILLGESDDLLVDPRAPYLHALDVLRHRADNENAAFLALGHQRSAEIQQWIDDGWLHAITPLRETVRSAMPRLRGLNDSDFAREREAVTPGSRIPSVAFEAIRAALARDKPALVQVPRSGYAPSLSCTNCRTPARCRHCNGPLELPEPMHCRWCGRVELRFHCVSCGHDRVRMNIIGHDRTTEDLGRAFPGTPVIASGGDRVKDTVRARASIVVATPGAEPWVEDPDSTEGDHGLYGSAIILDPWLTLTRADLRAGESAVRQWAEAAALVEPASDGGTVVVAAENQLAAVQQLLRWDAASAAHRELEARREAHFPPAYTVAAIDGTSDSIDQLLSVWDQPEGVELLGPVALPPGVRPPAGIDQAHRHRARRLIVRLPRQRHEELGTSLQRAQSMRMSKRPGASSRSGGGAGAAEVQALRVVIDPVRIG